MSSTGNDSVVTRSRPEVNRAVGSADAHTHVGVVRDADGAADAGVRRQCRPRGRVVMRDWRDSTPARVGFVVTAVLCPAGIALATQSGLSPWLRTAAAV